MIRVNVDSGNCHSISPEERNNEDNNYEGESSAESDPDDESENEYYLGKDEITIWKINLPSHNVRTARYNIITI